MVGLTITDETADEMEEDFDEVCASLERIILRQQQRILELEYVPRAMIDWWLGYEGLRDKDRKGLHHIFDGTKGHKALHHIFDMAFAAMKP